MLTIITQIKNEEQRLEEWVDYHINRVGFDKIIIYLDYPTDNSNSICEKLKERYDIETYLTDGQGFTMNNYKTANDYGGQVSFIDRIRRSYLSGTQLLQQRSEIDNNSWTAYIDVDEFIVQTGDVTLRDWISSLSVNRIFFTSYDMLAPMDLSKPLIEQANYRWSDKTRNEGVVNGNVGYFKYRHKSMCRTNSVNRVDCVHNILTGEKFITSGGEQVDMSNEFDYIKHDKEYFKLFHYRNDSLLPIYDEFDDTAIKIKNGLK